MNEIEDLKCQKYEINDIYIDFLNGKCDFDYLLNKCQKFFNSFAIKTNDRDAAMSLMNYNLYKITNIYDSSKGKPIKIIYTMCKNAQIDINKRPYNKRIVYSEDIDTEHFENIMAELPNIEDESVLHRLGELAKECGFDTNIGRYKWDKGEIPAYWSQEKLNLLKDKCMQDEDFKRLLEESNYGSQKEY